MPSTDESQTDLELVEAINRGDERAFELLYFRYRDWVTSLAVRFTGNHDDALDVLQETFSYVVRKFPGFELTAKMTTFLYPVVRNLSISARKKRDRSVSGDENLDLFPKDAESPNADNELSAVLGSLSDSHREILLLRFVDDLSQPEIATALDIPLGTVKSRLHHAIQSVRNSPGIADFLAGD